MYLSTGQTVPVPHDPGREESPVSVVGSSAQTSLKGSKPTPLQQSLSDVISEVMQHVMFDDVIFLR